MVYNNLDPVFMKTFMVNYLFEKNQTLKCEVYDFDGEGGQSDLIGQYSTRMNKILTAVN